MKSATGGTLQLVGSGVRVVSFLAIRVYAVGFYADVRALQEIREGKIEGWKVRAMVECEGLGTDEVRVGRRTLTPRC